MVTVFCVLLMFVSGALPLSSADLSFFLGSVLVQAVVEVLMLPYLYVTSTCVEPRFRLDHCIDVLQAALPAFRSIMLSLIVTVVVIVLG